VSFAELRKAGVELPASVVSELELAGVAIVRCTTNERGAVGVRLDPASEPPPPPTPAPGARRTPGARTTGDGSREQSHAVVGRTALAMRAKRLLALAVALAGLAAVASIGAILTTQGGSGKRPAPIAKRPHPQVTVAANSAPPPNTHTQTPTHPQPPVPVSPALATQLEAQGHDLLEAGQYTDAVPVLKRAVLATGETVGACVEPASTTCLTYAYALYDLGRAERLSGEPQAAVPILERRLQIDNQRSTVVAELQLARQGIE
jgi:hypothetical protein